MAKKFRDLVATTMTPAQRANARKMAPEMMAEMPLHELRQARALTQTALAETLNVAQPEISVNQSKTSHGRNVVRQ